MDEEFPEEGETLDRGTDVACETSGHQSFSCFPVLGEDGTRLGSRR